MKKVELKVLGMNCPHCEKRVVTFLSEIEGVLNSAASFKKKKVEVEFDETKTDENTIKETIKEAGFQVK